MKVLVTAGPTREAIDPVRFVSNRSSGKMGYAVAEAARDAGAQAAGYVMLRLPHELKDIWREWLQLHVPARAAHVMSLVRQMRGGKDYDSRFGTRQRGEGPFADLVAMRFAKTRKRLGYSELPPLRTNLFIAPKKASPQGELF